jgi:cytochrome c-type biogenesis protein CcmF
LTVIGYQALNISLILVVFSTVLYSFSGGNRRFIASAHRAVYATFALISLASIALLYAFFAREFQIQYVAHYSNRSLSWFYTATAFWAGQNGSLLLWVWLLTIFAVIVIIRNKNRSPELLPYTMAVMSFSILFFLFLVIFKTNPFARTPFVPPDGQGLNPLLQNPGMIFHPPSLYIGFVAFTVPFAFAISALLNKRLDEQWIKSIRRWTLFAWLFLTVGNILGMQWAYVELGWGGYWAWDPVENASLLPWLTGTAFLHSIIVQERKGMLKTWNLSLIIITFALTIFGTFVTRSGLISSVHAFGVSDMGPLFLGFLAIVLFGSFGLLVSRAKILSTDRKVGSWTSKESSFLVNNLLFVAMTIGVFWGTILPTVTEALNDSKMTVGAAFFNRMAVPIGIAIFLLTGLCALLSWGKTSGKRLLRNFILPGTIALVGATLFLVFGIYNFTALVALIVAVFAASTTMIEFIQGAVVRSRTDKMGFVAALLSLVQRNKRRYGGYIVHLGVLMLFLGIIGSSAFSKEKTVTLKKNQAVALGPYRLVFQGLSNSHENEVHIEAANFDLYKNGQRTGTIKSEKHLHPNFQPATEVGIRSTLAEDLYLVLADYDENSEAATISVMINPLILWMWIGGMVMVLGTLLAIWPQKREVLI